MRPLVQACAPMKRTPYKLEVPQNIFARSAANIPPAMPALMNVINMRLPPQRCSMGEPKKYTDSAVNRIERTLCSGLIQKYVNNCHKCPRSKMPSPLRRSEEHTSELHSRGHLVCRLLL